MVNKRQKPSNKTEQGSYLKSLTLSFILHVLLFGTFLASAYFLPKQPKTTNLTEVEFLTPQELAELQKDQPKNTTEVLNNQIVQQKNFINSQVDEKANFLSEKNQRVEKQTQAAARGEFKNTQKMAASKAAQAPKLAATSKSPTEKSPNQKSETNTPNLNDLFKKYDAAEGIQREQKKFEPKQANPEAQKVSANQQADASQGEGSEQSQTNDHLKNVDTGLQTLLSTREFKYYSYYDRIRRQLAQHWEDKVRIRLSNYYKKNRAPASMSEDRTTKIIVILNSAGDLVRVQIVGASGIQDLDEAATDAFRAAAPFPNPPKGILESDGTVRIRWDFVLEV